MLQMPPAQIRFAINGLDPHQAHEPPHPLSANLMTRVPQLHGQLPGTVKRLVRVQPINQLHQFKIGRFYRLWLPVDGRTRHPQQLALPFDGHVLIFFCNLFDPLRAVYFLSTSDKKSRSATSCPIV